jgi:hypothetical protein
MMAIGLLLLTGVAHSLEGAWPYTWPIMLLGLLWAPGLGWAQWLSRNNPVGRLQLGIDAAWIGMGTAWIDVAIVREAGIRGPETGWWLLGLAAAWAVTGQWMGLKNRRPPPTPRRELGGTLAVLLAVIAIGVWRADDVTRPLDGYWYLDGAAEGEQERIDLQPGAGWAATEVHGWPEAGAWSGLPTKLHTPTTVYLSSPGGAQGQLVLAVRGPIGSWIKARGIRNEVASKMVEAPADGPVLRYLERGVAAIQVPVDLAPGESMPVGVQGEAVYVMPSSEAVWALHGTGELRFVHNYQLLNQAENQVWAQEMLTTRRATMNQPPGWSPLLSVATVFTVPDLQAGTALFLCVLLLVGATSVRLGSLLAPGAPATAWLVPAGMVASHGLLMFEPASFNFPDSLYAAALLAVAAAIASGRGAWIAALGIAAGLLRWPGVVVTSMLLLAWWVSRGDRPWRHLGRLWGLVLLGGLVALAGVITGDLEDLLFILYFETFPEHWHGNYDAAALLSRVPSFYRLWLVYTGGGLLIAATGLFGTQTKARQGVRFLLLGFGAYSLLLCTIDHHVSHYFLPLVGATGAAVWAASAAPSSRWVRSGLPIVCLAGLWIFLWVGQI